MVTYICLVKRNLIGSDRIEIGGLESGSGEAGEGLP